MVAILPALIPALPHISIPLGLALPGLLFLALGILDDLKSLQPGPKFCVQVAAAVVAVLAGNNSVICGIAPVDGILSALWILTLVNAFNFIDVCDGLLGGLAVIGLLLIAALLPAHSLLCMALAGSCVGFLFLNWPPARIFLGDAGSHLLGFVVASLLLTLGRERNDLWPWVPQAMLIVGVPLFELVFITVVRIRKGIPWWRGSPDHFPLRLQQAGLSRLSADITAWIMAALLGITALWLGSLPFVLQLLTLAAVVFAMLLFARLLLKWEVRRAQAPDLSLGSNSPTSQ